MKKHSKFIIFIILWVSTIITIMAQEKSIAYNFKKGEVLDILLLTNSPEATSLFPKYRQTAFPIATKFSFSSIPGFSISETTQGGAQPEAMIFGKWDSKKLRENFLDTIVAAVPDFHEQRRKIWTYFKLTYYEMSDDVTFKINRSKYNVVTSYWGSGSDFTSYLKEFTKNTAQQGGKEIVTLTNGFSPVGYHYNPDYLTITQWKSKEEFEKFYKTHQALEEKRIADVHQFILN